MKVSAESKIDADLVLAGATEVHIYGKSDTGKVVANAGLAGPSGIVEEVTCWAGANASVRVVEIKVGFAG